MMSGCHTNSIVLVLLLGVSACSDVNIYRLDRQVKGAPYSINVGDPALELQAKANRYALTSYQDEWQRRDAGDNKKREPQRCLALSGGGIRAAAFSVGVMKGLHSIKNDAGVTLLDDIDIIGATSGGAYALMRYYLQQYGENPEPKDRVFDYSNEQKLVKQASFYSPSLYGASIVANTLMLPVNLLANGVFGLHWNTSPARRIYEGALNKTFFQGKDADFPELEKLIIQNHLPFLVITATARIDEDRFHHDAKLAKTIFEFTPLRYGSDALGFVPPRPKDPEDPVPDNSKDPTLAFSAPFPFSARSVVAIAGSAPDSTQVVAGAAQRVLSSGLNWDYGAYIPNYRTFPRKTWYHDILHYLPIPLYFLSKRS
jgi:hypothetical protein